MYRIGKCLLKLRLNERRMTQRQLSDITGISEQQLSNYSSGLYYMSVEKAKNISNILGCDIEDLYEWIPIDKQAQG